MTVALEHQARAALTPGRGRKGCAHAGDSRLAGLVATGARSELVMTSLMTIGGIVNSERQTSGSKPALEASRPVPRTVSHLTPGERVARGKAARNETPERSRPAQPGEIRLP